MADTYLSKEKIEELQAHLKELKTTKRFEIAERLKRAKEFGDLSENFEYAHAKEDQEKLEREIFEIENVLKSSKIITKSRNKDTVSVGLTVIVKAINNGSEKIKLTLVGSQEADPMNNKISNTSPIGKALLGKKIGETATVVTPKGKEIKYTVLEIE